MDIIIITKEKIEIQDDWMHSFEMEVSLNSTEATNNKHKNIFNRSGLLVVVCGHQKIN